ncbi:MAG: 50S ribosome-binding GTPase [Bacteroidaceae bacterium]|nr:50S ribosome-binding GTPase [Bacteroidaceae bacterium]
MNITNYTPNVVFIGAKETGKTTTIEKLWHTNRTSFQVQENIEGRGPIVYSVTELPFISFSIESEINGWITKKEIHEQLKNADVIVFLLPIDNITFSRKAKFVKQLQEANAIKDSVSIIIGLSQIENLIEVGEFRGTNIISLDDCSNIIERKTVFYKEFSRYINGIDFDISNVIPFSYLMEWQLDILKDAIVEGVIRRHNELVFDNSTPTIVFIGKTGCGKSSTINSLCGTDLPVDGAVACTKYPIVINKEILHNGIVKRLNIVDLPGIAESLEANIIYADYYNKYIKTADTIVCLSQANTRAYKQDEDFYIELIDSGIISLDSYIILGINKIDLLFKSDEHLSGIDLSTITDEDLLIKDKIDDYYNRVFSNIFGKISSVNRNSVVVYSNLQQWNMDKLAQKLFSTL